LRQEAQTHTVLDIQSMVRSLTDTATHWTNDKCRVGNAQMIHGASNAFARNDKILFQGLNSFLGTTQDLSVAGKDLEVNYLLLASVRDCGRQRCGR
jgi:hypothetical protein